MDLRKERERSRTFPCRNQDESDEVIPIDANLKLDQ